MRVGGGVAHFFIPSPCVSREPSRRRSSLVCLVVVEPGSFWKARSEPLE